jgi:uncharacterized protein (TIGR02001 family)
MTHSMTTFAKSTVLAAILATIGTASFAQTATPAATAAPAAPAAAESTLSYNVGAITDYRYRGISQSRLKPAVSAGVDYTHASGAYVGGWISSIQWIKDAGGNAKAEIDIYGGYKGTAGAVSYDVGVLTYQYPSAALKPSPNTTEIYGAATVGPATLKYSHALTNTFGFANSKNSGYVDLSATFDVGNGFTVVPHVGYQRIAGSGNGDFSYADYSVSVTKDFGKGLTVTAAVVGTDAKKGSYFTPSGKNTGAAGVTLGVKYSF